MGSVTLFPAVEILFHFSKAGVAEALSRLQSIASSDVNAERRQSAQEFLDQLPAPLDIPRRRE